MCLQASTATSAQAAAADANEKLLTLKWLGNAGWEIQIGPAVILTDPFLTRGEASPGKDWKTDEEAVLRMIKRADYIFAGHSHADHVADIPFIAKKFGSKVIGSRTTTNIALTPSYHLSSGNSPFIPSIAAVRGTTSTLFAS